MAQAQVGSSPCSSEQGAQRPIVWWGGEGSLNSARLPLFLSLSHTHAHRDEGALPVAQARMRARMYVKLQPTLDYEADV